MWLTAGAGILLVVLGVLTWIAALTVGQAIAALLIVIGVLLVLYAYVPAHYYNRR